MNLVVYTFVSSFIYFVNCGDFLNSYVRDGIDLARMGNGLVVSLSSFYSAGCQFF